MIQVQVHSQLWITQRWEDYWSFFCIHRLLLTLHRLQPGCFCGFLFCFVFLGKCAILAATTCTILVSNEKIIVDLYHYLLSRVLLQSYQTTIWLFDSSGKGCIHIFKKGKKQQQQKQYIHLTIIVCHTSFGSYETSFVHFDGWNEHFEFIYKYEQSDRHSRRFQIRDPWKRQTEKKNTRTTFVCPNNICSVATSWQLRVKHCKYFPEGHWRF